MPPLIGFHEASVRFERLGHRVRHLLALRRWDQPKPRERLRSRRTAVVFPAPPVVVHPKKRSCHGATGRHDRCDVWPGVPSALDRAPLRNVGANGPIEAQVRDVVTALTAKPTHDPVTGRFVAASVAGRATTLAHSQHLLDALAPVKPSGVA